MKLRIFKLKKGNMWIVVINCLSIALLYQLLVTNPRKSQYTQSVQNDDVRKFEHVHRSNSCLSEEKNQRHGESCPEIPPNLVGSIQVDLKAYNYSYINSRFRPAGPGGNFRPAGCRAESTTAIIVPFRDRDTHLRIFLNNIIPFLIKQQADFTVFLIEQAPTVTFNKAALMNIGFVEASKMGNFTCFIFHDVDLLPENDFNLYRCGKHPRHFAVANEKLNYTSFTWYTGGVIGMTKSTYLDVNGHSNMYFGWGGEDDDMAIRLRSKGYKLLRYPVQWGRYRSIPHAPDDGNHLNLNSKSLLAVAEYKMHKDGLNSLHYSVLKRQKRHVYTHIVVDFKQLSQRKILVSCFLVIHLTANGVEGRRRLTEVRTTEEIAIGCSLVGVFLVVVAVCTLYCRFCTKRKREERKLAKNAVEAAPDPPAVGSRTGSGSGSGSSGGSDKKKDKTPATESVPANDVNVDVPNIDITSPVNTDGKTPEESDEIESVKDEIVKPASSNNMTSISEIE